MTAVPHPSFWALAAALLFDAGLLGLIAAQLRRISRRQRDLNEMILMGVILDPASHEASS